MTWIGAPLNAQIANVQNSPEELDIHLNVFGHRRLQNRQKLTFMTNFGSIGFNVSRRFLSVTLKHFIMSVRENWQQVKPTCL